MPWRKKQAEELFNKPQTPNLGEQEKSDRASAAEALHDKTAKLKSLRLAKEAAARDHSISDDKNDR